MWDYGYDLLPRPLQEKHMEQLFVDLSKAFDTVNRSALWIILGGPSGFVDLSKQLHLNMKARVNFNGSLS